MLDEDAVGELQVAVDGSVGIGCGGDEGVDLLFLLRREEGVVVEETEESVFDVLELSGIHMRGVQAFAQLRKLACVGLGHLGVVAAGA